MASRKILYVCQEIMPYLPESELSSLSRHLAQAMQERQRDSYIYAALWLHK